MTEKIRHISNPLTVIAIFSGLAEIAGTVALPLVKSDLQQYFIWYVMGLPIILVILFFVTLNFNPKVLYSPSDYENEDNFMSAVLKQVKIDSVYKSIENEIGDIKQQIKDIPKPTKTTKLFDELNSKIESLNSIINQSKQQSNSDIDTSISEFSTPQSALQAKIYSFLITEGENTIEELSKKLGMSRLSLMKSLERLIKRNLVSVHANGSSTYYHANIGDGVFIGKKGVQPVDIS